MMNGAAISRGDKATQTRSFPLEFGCSFKFNNSWSKHWRKTYHSKPIISLDILSKIFHTSLYLLFFCWPVLVGIFCFLLHFIPTFLRVLAIYGCVNWKRIASFLWDSSSLLSIKFFFWSFDWAFRPDYILRNENTRVFLRSLFCSSSFLNKFFN